MLPRSNGSHNSIVGEPFTKVHGDALPALEISHLNLL